MSATVKGFLAAAAILSASSTAPLAQSTETDFFSNLTSTKPDDSVAVVSTTNARIEMVINAILEEIASSGDIPERGKDITVEELDALNRQVQRTQSAANLRQARFDELKAQLEMLMAMKAAEQELHANDETVEADVVALETAKVEAEATREAEAAAARERLLLAEQSSIPRVSLIVGSAGAMKATIQDTASSSLRTVQPGDVTAKGFTILAITKDAVKVRGPSSGSEYMISPSSEAPPPSTGSEADLAPAIDLGAGGDFPSF